MLSPPRPIAAILMFASLIFSAMSAHAEDGVETVTVTGDRAHLIETKPNDTALGLDKPLIETPRAVTVVSDTTVDRYGVTGVDTLTAITPSAYTASFYGVEGAVNLRGTLAESYFRGFKRADNRGAEDAAARLRAGGIDAELLALRPTGGDVHGMHVHVAVATPDEAEAAALAGAVGAHLVVDCGGAVRGIRPDDGAAHEAIASAIPLTAVMGIADAATLPASAEAALDTAAGLAGGLRRHLHGTRGVLAGRGGVDDYVRVGRGLYGIPLADGTPTGTPVARLAGRVITVKRIKAGEGVSYGYIYRAERDGVIALITGGYADGVPRSIGNHAFVLLNGNRARIVGRVAMDVVVAAVDDARARPGDEAVFFGDPGLGEPGVGEWASITGYDPVEVAAAIGPRVARSFTR